MELVTVTCKRDLPQMLLQAESIQKFLKPCVHWVIVNDRHIDQDSWRNLLSPYYQNHQLKLLFTNWKDYKYDGWFKQQLYKLSISNYINDDYVVLDSKNFFIKSCDIDAWKNTIGPGCLDYNIQKAEYISASNYIANYFNIEPLKTVLSSETPFVFNHDIVKKAISSDNFFRWFNNKNCSEFIFYSYLIKDKLTGPLGNPPKHRTLWHYENQLTDLFFNNIHCSDITVFGLHRYLLNNIDKSSLNELNNFLDKLGFKNKLKKRTWVNRVNYQFELIKNYVFPNY
jgi:hypothetical protein